MPLLGLAALVWFLIRVIPKPSRAAYPCQRAAFPLASAFVIWLAGTIASAKIYIRLKRKRYFTAPVRMLFFITLVSAATLVFQPADRILGKSRQTISFIPTDDPNTPMGVARGIYPGRVAWVHHPEAVLFDGFTGYFWQQDKVDQAAVDDMFSRSLKMLTGEDTDANAWDAVFRYFNERRGNGSVGYTNGEKIAIKINMNTANNHFDSDAYMNTTPHAAMALARQLVEEAGVPEEMIAFYEVSRPIAGYLYSPIHDEYPGIVFIDRDGGNGRLKYQEDISCEVAWSQELTLENGGGHSTFLPEVVSEASYIINLGNLKGHDLAGQSLCAKNHVGTIISENPDKPDLSDPRSAGIHPYIAVHDFAYWSLPMRDMGSYNTLVDLMGHEDLGEKTLIFIIDGLFATQVQHSKVDASMKWTSEPFNGHFTSSIFMSLDGVAIESVGLDFTRNEPTLAQVYGNVDNYLHEAALANDPPSEIFYDPEQDGSRLTSLGVHEHWNNASDRKYTRNLDTGEGIELVSFRVQDALPEAPGNLAAVYIDENEEILLTWSDFSDNETGVVVERKNDDEDIFSEIGTTGIDRVSFRDESFLARGTVQYRIKAAGETGDSDFSPVAEVQFGGTRIFDETVSTLEVYPNPAVDMVRLTQPADRMELYDMGGKRIMKIDHVRTGEPVYLSGICPGTYIINLIVGDAQVNRKLIIQ